MIELDVQHLIQIEAAKIGMILLRNNSGCLRDVTGREVRFGLGNDSKRVNEVRKSSDLIGWRHGRFCAVECKAPGWRYRAKGREVAQLNFINAVLRDGGFACFATSWQDVYEALKENCGGMLD